MVTKYRKRSRKTSRKLSRRRRRRVKKDLEVWKGNLGEDLELGRKIPEDVVLKENLEKGLEDEDLG